MSFFVSKLVGGLLAPGTILLLLLLGAFLWQRRRPLLSRGLLGLSLLFVAALSLLPLGRWLIWPLETRFPAPTELHLEQVDGIILLGGAINADESFLTSQPALNDAGDRITRFVALARQYPNAKLVWTGGSASVWGTREYSEATYAQILFAQLGIPAERIIFERESRNTWENALLSQKLVQPQPGETWLLLTSAWHMPRSVGIFRKVGWNVVPYSVDYLGADPHAYAKFEAQRELYAISVAAKEWVGLISYHLLGRTDAWFPAPRAPDKTNKD